MPYKFITYDKPESGVARITLNRPESLNAMNNGLIADVYAAAEEAKADSDVVVLIYRGAGRAFCVGRDFKEVAEYEQQHHDGTQTWRAEWHGWGHITWFYPKATISQVHGYALGGGEWLAAFSDVTVASEDAVFGFPEGRWGILSGGFHHWNWLIGPKMTKEYILTGRNLSAQEALQSGLVNHVVPRDELEATTLGIARDIVANERRTPGFVEANKGAINGNHLEFLRAAQSFSPLGSRKAEAKLRVTAAKFADEFHKTIAEKGMRDGLNKMHEGNTSRF
jgi:enoyl-CoA hydratase/carnithine racemase